MKKFMQDTMSLFSLGFAGCWNAFHSTDWLIGVSVMVYHNVIFFILDSNNALYSPNVPKQQGSQIS